MKLYPKFYRAVWLACSKIPKGKTLSYKELAVKIGRPKAFRAVGLALKKNPFAPIIPCHRVIGSKGGLVGYSGPGGIQNKRKMLKEEKAI
ncbi:MAG: MGMT family protein [Elusimicrobia bacterium]|nr:MGMT family protein [Candidatus Liberimonas magnetica]